jgi:uncharacterized membrane protein YgcG
MIRALLAALALLFAAPAAAEERILHFLSDVRVQQDGSLDVSETIRVRAEGDSIQRGILRDFPTRYRRDGRTVRVGFDVDEVRRDGKAEPWSVESIDGGERIRIGDADVMLPRGVHEYRIRYRTTKQLGFFRDYDELYWNATGNGWTFPIDVAEARITLPSPARFGNRAVYTGFAGSTDRNAEVVAEGPGTIAFRSTMPLAASEGMTVAVAWPKNVVAAPPPRSAGSLWLQDNGPRIAAAVGILAILAYYLFAWVRAGRGPREGTIVPLFSPPDDLSAAATRYISRMSFDNRTFAAAVVDLGVRGKLRLVEGEKPWFGRAQTTIHKTAEGAGLPAPERAMMASLMGSGSHVLMDKSNHAAFGAARSALSGGLSTAYRSRYYVENGLWALAGIGLLLAAIWLAVVAVLATDPDLAHRSRGLEAALFGLGAVVAALLLVRRARRETGLTKVLLLIVSVILAAAAFLSLILAFGAASDNGRVLPMLAPMLTLPLILSGFWWMGAPTKEGRAMMDRIAGFRRYLATTEEERLETLHPPEKTPQLFERYLPYAIALDVENAWAARFTSVLAAAAAAGTAGTMAWYSGHSDPWNDARGFVGDMGSSLASSITSASTAPGSSSGSSGGGSSGGGGGGGGGSGW